MTLREICILGPKMGPQTYSELACEFIFFFLQEVNELFAFLVFPWFFFTYSSCQNKEQIRGWGSFIQHPTSKLYRDNFLTFFVLGF